MRTYGRMIGFCTGCFVVGLVSVCVCLVKSVKLNCAALFVCASSNDFFGGVGTKNIIHEESQASYHM